MTYVSMNELMEHYEASVKSNDWSTAYETLEYGIECGHLPAMISMGKLLKRIPCLDMPQNERYMKAEYYLQSSLNILDLPDHISALICLELADLYGEYLDRQVASLAYLLKAKRLGAIVDDVKIEQSRRRMSKIDINQVGADCKGAFELGLELDYAGGYENLAEFMLQEAAESKNTRLVGRAALELDEFYAKKQDPVYASLSREWFKKAADAGYPEYLSSRRIVA